MPSLILINAVLMDAPNQNAGLFLGEGNVGGWDANRKMSQAYSGVYGFFNLLPAHVNINLDNFEFIDGAINDSDWKLNLNSNA